MDQRLKELVDKSRYAVFFGGAGVSVPSGIPDFRSQDGLYHQTWKYPPEKIISHSYFIREPEEFFRFYKQKMLYPQARPNAAHLTLAQWEQEGKLKAVITQNIDGLHQAAGSREVVELHGSVHRNRCMKCGSAYDMAYVAQAQGVPRCACGGLVKPEVVLYEEPLADQAVDRALYHIQRADVLIVGGTSLAVYPAAGFLEYFRGSHLAVINRTPGPKDHQAQLVSYDDSARAMGRG